AVRGPARRPPTARRLPRPYSIQFTSMRSGLLCHSCNLQSPRSRRARSVLLEEFRQLVEQIFKSIGYNFFVGTFVALNLGIIIAAQDFEVQPVRDAARGGHHGVAKIVAAFLAGI